MLHINDLTYRLGERLLIDHATVALPTGARVGLVGRNGAGKTTLFRLIAEEISPESGAISRSSGMPGFTITFPTPPHIPPSMPQGGLVTPSMRTSIIA